jgi:protein involved in sex pheromone biosynthesis
MGSIGMKKILIVIFLVALTLAGCQEKKLVAFEKDSLWGYKDERGQVIINPKYISYIYEQNYLNSMGNTAGISLAIVLNPYQSYTNNNGVKKYGKADSKIVINYGKSKANTLLNELKKIPELKNKQILIALYLENSPDSLIPGNYVYEAETNNFKITNFNKVNEKYYLLPSEEISKVDQRLYNAYSTLESNIIKLLSDYTAIIGRALYINNQCLEIDINIHSVSAHKGDILAISQKIAKELISSFDAKIDIQIDISSNNKVESLIIRNKSSFNPQIYILD